MKKVIFLLFVACQLLMTARSSSQVAVDLRTPVVNHPSVTTISSDNYNVYYQLLALRTVLQDLTSNAQSLQAESGNILKDANGLWNTWKNYFGIRGSLINGTLVNNTTPEGNKTVSGERLQMKIYNLNNKAQQIKYDADNIVMRLQQADESWSNIRNSVLPQKIDDQLSLVFQPTISELRATLSALSMSLNTLDSTIQSCEEDMDGIYPRFEKLFSQKYSEIPPITRPWHWKNMLSNNFRKSMKYDFEAQLTEAIQKARNDFPTKNGVKN